MFYWIEKNTIYAIDGEGVRVMPVIRGGKSGGGTTTQTVTPDPTAQAFNQLLLGQAQSVAGATGGFPQFAGFQQASQPGAGERALFQRIAGFADRPAIDPFQTQGLAQLFAGADPTLRLQAAQSQLEGIIAPQIVNQLTRIGQGRSGAIAEALSQAGTSLALPILMDQAQAQRGLGSTLLSFGPSVEQRELGRLGRALDAIAAPRESEMAERARQLGVLQFLFSGGVIPAGFGSTTTQRTPGQSLLPTIIGGGLNAASTALAAPGVGPGAGKIGGAFK